MDIIEVLKEQRAILIDYLNLKLAQEDWHGCADAAMDLRDLDVELNLRKQFKWEERSNGTGSKGDYLHGMVL